MDRVNSLRLNKYDAYGRRFDVDGMYRYHITFLGGGLEGAPVGMDYELIVKEEREEKGQQHNVQVIYDEKARRYRAKPERLVINSGDLVLWTKPDKQGIDYTIVGESEKDRFDSRRLGKHTVYTHTFRQVGTYKFENTYGKGGEQSGLVRVVPASKDREAWSERLIKPPVITYAKGRFAPQEVEVVELGTVIWSVEDDVGISIVGEPPRRVGKVAQIDVRPRRRVSPANE